MPSTLEQARHISRPAFWLIFKEVRNTVECVGIVNLHRGQGYCDFFAIRQHNFSSSERDNLIKKTHIDIPKDDNYNICVLLEPYTNPPWTDVYDYIRTDFEKFDLIITHNLQLLGDLIESRPDKFHYSTKCLTTSWLSEEHIGLHEKTKNISMAFSHKNFSEGHRIRHLIYEKYKNENIIDFYGSGVDNFSGEFRNAMIDYKYTIFYLILQIQIVKFIIFL